VFTNILGATDGFEQGFRAVQYAGWLAADEGARLHIVHVIEKLVTGRDAGRESRTDEDAILWEVHAQADELSQRGVELTVHAPVARAGSIPSCVAHIARANDIELIVVGTRGHAPLVGAIIGSVAQGLLHAAPCPVLAVSPAWVAHLARDHRPATPASGS
jgi:nucleotide-binding universal stress UspA family protein